MRRGRRSASKTDPGVVEEALGAMDADELRKLVCDMLVELDDHARGLLANRVVDRAARNSSAWTAGWRIKRVVLVSAHRGL